MSRHPEIPLHWLDAAAPLPARATDGSFGYDLAAIREERIAPSGLLLKHDLILPNAPGLIDADYAGPIGIIVHDLRDEECVLPAGTRIAQAIFAELRFPVLRDVDAADSGRTRGGFGSTG